MLTTWMVIAGVLIGLVGLLALIVSLSARPSGGWVADTGRRHPDAWSAPVGPATAELPTGR